MKKTLHALIVLAAVVSIVNVARAQEAYRPGNGVTLPKVKKEVRPQYTQEAKDAHIEGTVLIECVVLESGTVSDAKVVRSLDPTYGLDKQAVKAAAQWEFEPGTKDGKPVPVRIAIELTFTLK
jgi:TonB family protein